GAARAERKNRRSLRNAQDPWAWYFRRIMDAEAAYGFSNCETIREHRIPFDRCRRKDRPSGQNFVGDQEADSDGDEDGSGKSKRDERVQRRDERSERTDKGVERSSEGPDQRSDRDRRQPPPLVGPPE